MEALLKLRRMDEEKALGHYASTLARVNEQRAIVENSKRLFDEETERFGDKYEHEYTLDLYKIYHLYLERLESDTEDAEKAMQGMQPELQERLALLNEARRRRKVVELLKERKKADFDKKLRKLERKQIEESNYLTKRKRLESDEHAGKDKDRRIAVEDSEAEGLLTDRENRSIELAREYLKDLGVKDTSWLR